MDTLHLKLYKSEVEEKEALTQKYNITFVESIGLTRCNAIAKPNGEVVITHTLYRRLSTNQLKAIIEHELCHVKHRDGQVRMILSFILTLGTIVVVRRAPKGLKVKTYIWANIITQLIVSLFSWFIEFRADRAASNESAMIMALNKIEDYNESDVPKFMALLNWTTHPPTMLRAWMINKFR